MLLTEPNANQHRTAAVVLVVVAASTAALVAIAWVESLNSALLLPLVVAYFVFNFGYAGLVLKDRIGTKGAKVGHMAVALNLLAMLLSSFLAVWTALSLFAVPTALVGAALLFMEAKRAAR